MSNAVLVTKNWKMAKLTKVALKYTLFPFRSLKIQNTTGHLSRTKEKNGTYSKINTTMKIPPAIRVLKLLDGLDVCQRMLNQR